MAKKIPTSRIILYVILGIVVIVLAVWVIRTRSQEAKMGKRVMEVEDVPKFVRNMTKRIERLEEELSGLSGASADQARQLVQEVRTAIDEIQTLNDPQAIGAKRDEIMDKITEAQKLRRKAKEE